MICELTYANVQLPFKDAIVNSKESEPSLLSCSYLDPPMTKRNPIDPTMCSPSMSSTLEGPNTAPSWDQECASRIDARLPRQGQFHDILKIHDFAQSSSVQMSALHKIHFPSALPHGCPGSRGLKTLAWCPCLHELLRSLVSTASHASM